MAALSPLHGRSRQTARARLLPMLFLLALVVAQPACAQEEAAPTPQQHAAPTYTLHVYHNLMQFPTLVLGTDGKPIPPIPKDHFAVTLDGGPVFHPTQMRLEGDDAISLAVVLDTSGSQRNLVQAFPAAFATLLPAFLHSNDRVSIYAEDCTLIRTTRNAPADHETIATYFANALAAPTLHNGKSKPACGGTVHQWDNVYLAARDLATEPGRRVLLVITTGEERNSKVSFSDASSYAAFNGVAVFRLRDSDEVSFTSQPMSGLSGRSGITVIPRSEDLFESLCAVSGGITLDATPARLVERLREFIMLLRNRYIIEFPRPSAFAGARHVINISVPNTIALIRSTGATTPSEDPALLADPNTVPTTPSPAKVGTRHPMSPTP